MSNSVHEEDNARARSDKSKIWRPRSRPARSSPAAEKAAARGRGGVAYDSAIVRYVFWSRVGLSLSFRTPPPPHCERVDGEMRLA